MSSFGKIEKAVGRAAPFAVIGGVVWSVVKDTAGGKYLLKLMDQGTNAVLDSVGITLTDKQHLDNGGQMKVNYSCGKSVTVG